MAVRRVPLTGSGTVRTIGARPAIALAAACLSLGAGLRLPDSLADYRSWSSLSTGPTLVPASLAALCTPISKARLEEVHAAAAKTDDPHPGRYVRVYLNPTARRALAETETGPFPPGTAIAKEKLLQPGDRREVEVAFMIKREPGQFAESDGWEFRYYPSRSGATFATCVECHRAGGSRDYVFSRPSS